MARQPWAIQFRNAREFTEQISVLRSLKNEIVGHPVQKEIVVAEGVLDPVVRLTSNKSGSRQDGRLHDNTFAPRPLTEEEIVRLQGLHVLASLAMGGPPFLQPLQSAAVLPTVLSNLCPLNNPPQLVLASLRAISNLADSSSLAPQIDTLGSSAIAEALFSRQHLISLCRVLSQISSSSSVQCQISLVASLISRICKEERHQQSLANSGVLDALATKLASFVVAEGLVIPRADLTAQRDGFQEHFPQPAPRNASLPVILEAVAVIIEDSKLRASQLLYSPSILAVLPPSQSTDLIRSQNARAAWNAFNSAGLSAKHSRLNAVDYLLPFVPFHPHKISNGSALAFPPLGSSVSRENLASAGSSGASKQNSSSLPSLSDPSSLEIGLFSGSPTPDSSEPESPLVAYLVYILRQRNDMERLMAAAVLTVLYRTGLTNSARESAIGILVVPLLVDMIDDIPIQPKSKDSLADDETIILDRAIKERAPAILAKLITDNEYLHKAAFEAGAIAKLSKMLKVSYDPVPEVSHQRPWSPHDHELGADTPSSQFSVPVYTPLLAHKIKVRESTLKAIASIIPFRDEYRKVVVDQGMLPYVVESMSSCPSKPSPKGNEKSEKVANGSSDNDSGHYGINPENVLIAGCVAVRALSRSVSILRTTLIDNGVAMPVFRLLQHPDIEVQIAATGAVCNLVTDVSPMKDIIAEAGIVRILCEHAHSMNPKLRLNALWALKHYVNAVENDVKRSCLEELGQGWLVQLICDDTEDEALFSSKVKGERNPASNDDGDEDVEMDQFEEQVDAAFETSFPRSTNVRPGNSRNKSAHQADLRLAMLRDAETNPIRKARKDDIAIQEQGLDFIRNLIGHSSPHEAADMVDHLFTALGQDRVFEILSSKLRPKVINPFNRRSSSEPKVQPPQTEIIVAVCYILVHMAGSIPRHRALIIAQTDLLKQLLPQFNHSSIEVRVALCQLVINLAWMEDSTDQSSCLHRTNELKKLGFYDKMEILKQDPELNIRERAKSALYQLEQFD